MKEKKILPFLGEGGQEAVNAIDVLLDYAYEKRLDRRYSDFLEGFREAIITSKANEYIKHWLDIPVALRDPTVQVGRLAQFEYRTKRFPEQYDESLDIYCCTDEEFLKTMAGDLCVLAVYYLVHNSPEEQDLEYWKNKISDETEKRIGMELVYRHLHANIDDSNEE